MVTDNSFLNLKFIFTSQIFIKKPADKVKNDLSFSDAFLIRKNRLQPDLKFK